MKKLLILAAMLFMHSSFAAVVNSAKIDDSGSNIVVEVTYGGGCKEHKFELQVKECAMTFPVKCQADLVETVVDGTDYCEAMITEKIELNLRDYNLDDVYYSGASLTINGDLKNTGAVSQATVILPRVNGINSAVLKFRVGEPDPR